MQAPFDVDRLRVFLRKYGLDPVDLNVVPLGGDDNLNLHIRLDDGQSLILRQYQVTAEDEIDFELELIDFLTAHAFPTAHVLRTIDRRLRLEFDGRPAALFQYIDGCHPAEMDGDVAEQLAATLADLHVLTRDFSFDSTRSRTDFARLDALQNLDVSSLADPLIGSMIDDVNEFRCEVETRIAGSGADLPIGIVHHDVHTGNVLVDSRNKLIGLIDFDEMHVSWLLIDLAGLLHYWAMEDGRLLTDGAVRLLKIYDERRPLTSREWELLPEFILLCEMAGAADYVTRALTSDPQRHVVQDCNSYRTFLKLNADSIWRTGLIRA